MIPALSTIALVAGAAVASPINLAAGHVNLAERDMASYTADVTIHESCNSTQRRMLEKALADTWEVASFAKEYIVNNGPQDPIFQLYFGNETASYSTAIGVWDSILTSNKEGVLLRCDNIDGNCQFPGWRGHWRGENGTSETVICDASYTDRKFNEAFCMDGFQLATTKPSYYWSVDLIHRLLHVPQLTNGLVDHFAENLEEVIELAAHNATYSPIDSDALQYFAAHVYAKEVAQGGDACIGEIGHGMSHSSDSHSAPAASSAAASSAAPAATSAAASSAAAAAPAPAATSAAAQDCHTHADGTLHCV